MHDVLRQRLIRKIESLPEEQVYQVLDYIEFLESKYGQIPQSGSGLQRFAEGLEDKLRKKAMNPATLREAFQIISTADKVLASVSNAGKQLMDELTGNYSDAEDGAEDPEEIEAGVELPDRLDPPESAAGGGGSGQG